MFMIFSSTTQETGAESETPVPTTITAEVDPHVSATPTAEVDPCVVATEVDPHVAATSTTSSSTSSDLGTVQSPSEFLMNRNTRFSQPFLLSSKSIQSIVRNGVINHTGLSSFLGFGTLHHWMVSFVVLAFCLVKLGSTASLSLHRSVIGRTL